MNRKTMIWLSTIAMVLNWLNFLYSDPLTADQQIVNALWLISGVLFSMWVLQIANE